MRRASFVSVTTLIVAALTAILGPTGMGTHVLAQDNPETLPSLGWRAASSALEADGSLSTAFSSELTSGQRKRLEKQIADFSARFGSARAHGLQEGQLPPKEFCVSYLTLDGAWRTPVSGGLFDNTLLLSEVAVIATVQDIVPGFDGDWPALLIALSDVRPLRPSSPLPNYLLAPADRMVAADRVFCGGAYEDPFAPSIGQRLVVVGSWAPNAVARVGNRVSAVGIVEGEGLTWRFGHTRATDTGPETLDDLFTRMDEFIDGGLFALTDGIRRLPVGRPVDDELWDARAEFSREWRQHYEEGCRPISADQTAEGEWQIRRICKEGLAGASEAAQQLKRPWSRLCEDGSVIITTSAPDGTWSVERTCPGSVR